MPELQLARQIQNMKRGDHACLIYDTHEHQLAAILPFIKSGLDRNESTLYISNDRTVEEICSIFNANGINVEREIERKALIFSSNSPDGKFHPRNMVQSLLKMSSEASARGFNGFRASGEMTWVLGSDCGCDKLIEYEVLLNQSFPTELTGICQYNYKRFKPEIIRDILRTHPVVIVKDKVCRNLYCEGERILNTDGENDQGIHWMMENLIRFHDIEEGLQNAIAARDDFFSVASHELNTPLTALLMRGQLFERKVSEPGEWKRFNEMNIKTIRHLASIVESMLDVTKTSKGILHINAQDNVDLADLTRSCISQLRGNAHVRIHVKEPVLGRWDPLRLQQLITNLIGNAIKYGEDKPIEVSIWSAEEKAYVSIEDHGIGIAPDDQKRIFDLYERAVPFTNISGLGIGLFISDQIARAHHGKISVESEIGRGSKFTVELPRFPEREAS